MVFNKIDLIDEKKLLELKERYSDSSDRSEFNPLWISVHANI
jgi:50S ribosomal subunit-associated GTPase HflX